MATELPIGILASEGPVRSAGATARV